MDDDLYRYEVKVMRKKGVGWVTFDDGRVFAINDRKEGKLQIPKRYRQEMLMRIEQDEPFELEFSKEDMDAMVNGMHKILSAFEEKEGDIDE